MTLSEECTCLMWITGLWGSYVPGTASSKSRHISSLGETYWSSKDVNWNHKNAQRTGFKNDSIHILVYGLSFDLPVGVVWRFVWKPSSTNPRPGSGLWHFLIVDTFCTIPAPPSDRDHMPDRKKITFTTNLMKKFIVHWHCVHTYILYWLVAKGLFRVKFTLHN